MTLQPAAFVDGGPINGVLLRRQLQSATRGASGIVEPVDLAVRPLDVPAAGFVIGDGASVIRGQDTAWDGSYYALNIGDTVVSDVVGTGSEGGRTDMVVLRVVPGAVVEPYIIQGVSATATTIAQTPEPGLSAIPLARITYPASTATITQDMITDLRTMLQPRSEYVIRTQQGISPIDYAGNIKKPNWENWPDLTWTVRVPTWATQVQVDASWVNMGFFPADYAGTGSRDARGETRISLISGSAEIVTATGAFNFNEVSSTNGYRVGMGILDDILIPTALRGATCGLRMQVSGDDVGGRLRADTYMHAGVRLMFNEIPVSAAS